MTLATLSVAALLTGSFSSCSSDGDSYVPTPTITDKDGNAQQITSVGGLRFTYDENGKLKTLTDGGKTYEIKDDKFSLAVADDDENASIDVYLDSDGLIVKIECKYGNDYETDEITIEYEYDDRRLESASASGEGEAKDHSYEGSADVEYKWENNNLMSVIIESESKGTDEGASYKESSKISYSYAYGDQANPAKQLPYYVGKEITGTDAFGGLFSVLGLFGYGPAFLPSGYVLTEEDNENGEVDTDSRTYIFTFELNDNGTLKSEMRNNSRRITYNYAPVTRSGDSTTQELLQYVRSIRSGLFMHKKK